MSIFLVGNTDFSNNVLPGTYDISTEDVYSSWTDGFLTEHRDICRTRLKGAFDMFFRTEEQYQAFLSALSSARQSNKSYKVQLKSNTKNTSNLVTAYCWVDFRTKRDVDGSWNDYFEKFTVNIEEI